MSQCSCCNAHGALESALLALLAMSKGWQSFAQEGCVNPTCPSMRSHSQEGINPGDSSASCTVCVLGLHFHTVHHLSKTDAINTLKLFQKESRHKASIKRPRTPLCPSNTQHRYFSGKYQLPVTFYSCFISPKSLFTVLFLLFYSKIQPSKWSEIFFQ